MHRIFQLPFLFGILFFACKPSRMHSSGPYTGKLIGGVCGNYTIQLVSGDMDPSRYVKTWSSNDTVYHNVFAINNSCSFGSYGLHPGDVFKFYLITEPPVNNCALCQIYYATPPISNFIKVSQ